MLNGRRVGICGLGLIGGSIALRAARLGAATAGWQPDAAALGAARAAGVVAEAADSLEALATKSDVLVLAAPLDAIVEQLAHLRVFGAGTALVLETGSVMGPAARAGRGLPGFVATHPMAGSERSGHGAASAELFEDRTWAYDPGAPPVAVAAARNFIEAMGARPVGIEPAAHDRAVALTSHLPQLLSVALGARLEAAGAQPGVAALCGPGIASMLRLARSSWPMWQPVFAANGEAVAQEVRALAAILMDAAAALDQGRAAALAPAFEAAARAAARLGTNQTGDACVERSNVPEET